MAGRPDAGGVPAIDSLRANGSAGETQFAITLDPRPKDGGRALTVSLDSPNSGALLRQLGVHAPTSGRRARAHRAQRGRRMGEGLRRRCGVAACRLGALVARPLPACGGERRCEAVWVRQGQVAEPRPARGRPWSCARQWRRARARRYRVRCDLARRSMEILAARGDDRGGQGERRASLFSLNLRALEARVPGERRDRSRRGGGSGLLPGSLRSPASGDRGRTGGRTHAARRRSGARARTAPAEPGGSALVGREVRATRRYARHPPP